jgi:NitT/TauT family transport system permease protein/taurine transport system permease protein
MFDLSRQAKVTVATIAAVIALWWLATSGLGLVNKLRLPSPGDVWSAVVQINTTGFAGATLWVQAMHSLQLVAKGFAVAVITGVPVGLLMGWSRRAEIILNPTFLILRPIPALAWIPLAIVWFGLGDAGKVFTIWLTAFVPSVINTYTGVRQVDPVLIAAARTQGASTPQVLRHVAIPGALPMIFTGLRLSLQASWTTLVAAELVGAFFGLGRVLNVAGQDIYPGMIIVGMAAVAVCGAATTWLLGLLERKVISWRPAT